MMVNKNILLRILVYCAPRFMPNQTSDQLNLEFSPMLEIWNMTKRLFNVRLHIMLRPRSSWLWLNCLPYEENRENIQTLAWCTKIIDESVYKISLSSNHTNKMKQKLIRGLMTLALSTIQTSFNKQLIEQNNAGSGGRWHLQLMTALDKTNMKIM